MNDFTKEELFMLRNGIQYLSDRTSLSDGYLSIHNELESKIQSLIDNYCEHIFVYINETPECIKCHAIPKEIE